MGIRLWLPLPGPFVAVSKSRAEKVYLRDRNAQRRRETYENMTPKQRSLAGFALALGILFTTIFVMWSAFGTTVGLAGTCLGLWWLSNLAAKKSANGLKPWED